MRITEALTAPEAIRFFCETSNSNYLMKTLLLPHVFRTIGWTILLIVFPYFVGCLFLDSESFHTLFSRFITIDGKTLLERISNNFLIIGWSAGSLFVTCGKVREEDEMTVMIRLNSLLISLYVYITLIVASALLIYNFNFLLVMMVNLALFPIIFLIVFELRLHAYRKISEDEE